MLRTAALLLAAILADSPPAFYHEMVEPVNLLAITPAAAARLDGHRGTFLLTLDPKVDADDADDADAVLRECLTSGPGVCCTALLPEGNHAGELVVEGVAAADGIAALLPELPALHVRLAAAGIDHRARFILLATIASKPATDDVNGDVSPSRDPVGRLLIEATRVFLPDLPEQLGPVYGGAPDYGKVQI